MAAPALAQTGKVDLVCDLTLASIGTATGGLRAPTSSEAATMRYAFSDLNPGAATAVLTIGDGASGREGASLALERGATVFLIERNGVSKTIVSVERKPGPTGWAAVMSQHAWAGDEVTIRTSVGLCRARNAG